jgi:hypothetical protein
MSSSSSSYQPLYIVDIFVNSPSEPELMVLPNAISKEEDTTNASAAFSLDPTQLHLV